MYPYSRYILWRGILTLGPPISGVSLLKEIAPSSPWNGDKLQWENARTFRSSPKQATSASLEVACDSLPLCLHRCFFRNRQLPSILTSQSQDLKILIIVNYIYICICDYVLPSNDRCTSAVFPNRPSAHSTDRGNLL